MSSPTQTTPPPTPTTPLTPSFNLPLAHRPLNSHTRSRSPIFHRQQGRTVFSSTPASSSNLRTRRSAAFLAKLQHISTALSPLVSLSTGTAHPSFPSTLLAFYLLTSAQLDELAAYYHQNTATVFSRHYPCPVYESWDAKAEMGEKRRRLGRFMGLRGCESPVLSEGEMVLRTVEMIERDVREERGRRAQREEFGGGKGRWL